jgi:hypothetical protein
MHPFQAQPGCNICVCGLPADDATHHVHGHRRRLTPIVVLVDERTRRALDDYVTVWTAQINPAAYDALLSNGNGWTAEMLIGGQLLTEGLCGMEAVEPLPGGAT